ncbi:hypothetical protein ACVWYU_001725 [Pseudomonas sp. TE12234]
MTRNDLITAFASIGIMGAVTAGMFDTMLSANTSTKPAIVALTPIADPATATVAQIGTLLNQLIAALEA